MASSRRNAAGRRAAALLLLLAVPSVLGAQTARLEPLAVAGRVLRVRRADTVGVAGAWVVLHRIGAREQGPVDSVRSDPAGRFRFRVASPESAAVYAVSSRYASIGYFGPPLNADAGSTAPPITLLVYDTATTGPRLTAVMRHVVVARPSADGSRRVLDITEVRNDGITVLVGADSLAPVWVQAVSPDLTEPQLGESDVSPGSVTFVDGAMRVAAPFPPGSKQIAASYVLPRGASRLRIPVDQPTLRLELLIEDSSSSVPGLAAAEPIELDGRAFRRFGADSLAGGRTLTVTFRGDGGLGGTLPLVAALVLATLGLGAGLIVAWRRRPPVAPAVAGGAGPRAAGDRETVLAQLVALDERFAGREAECAPEQWAGYVRRRSELKRALEQMLGER